MLLQVLHPTDKKMKMLSNFLHSSVIIPLLPHSNFFSAHTHTHHTLGRGGHHITRVCNARSMGRDATNNTFLLKLVCAFPFSFSHEKFIY